MSIFTGVFFLLLILLCIGIYKFISNPPIMGIAFAIIFCIALSGIWGIVSPGGEKVDALMKMKDEITTGRENLDEIREDFFQDKSKALDLKKFAEDLKKDFPAEFEALKAAAVEEYLRGTGAIKTSARSTAASTGDNAEQPAAVNTAAISGFVLSDPVMVQRLKDIKAEIPANIAAADTLKNNWHLSGRKEAEKAATTTEQMNIATKKGYAAVIKEVCNVHVKSIRVLEQYYRDIYDLNPDLSKLGKQLRGDFDKSEYWEFIEYKYMFSDGSWYKDNDTLNKCVVADFDKVEGHYRKFVNDLFAGLSTIEIKG